MRYRAIFDLHFLDGSPADDFGRANGPADEAVIRFCESSTIPLIVGGDLVDLWQAGLPAILKAHGEAIEVIMDHAEVVIAGNHDLELLDSRFFGHRVVRTFDDGAFHVEHGDLRDRFVRRHPWTCQAGSWLGGMAERVISHDVDVWAERAVAWLGGTGRHGDSAKYAAKIAEAGAAVGKRICAFGHTHQAGRWEVGGRLVLNGGTWTNDRRDYVLLDDSGDCTVEVFK